MTTATEQQARPLVAHLEAAGYQHQRSADTDAWELAGESCRIRVIIWPLMTMVRAYDAQMRPQWKAKFSSDTPDSRIVAFLSAEEKGMSDA